MQEFFTESHWSKLPLSWQDALYSADLLEVSRLLLLGGGVQSQCVQVEDYYIISSSYLRKGEGKKGEKVWRLLQHFCVLLGCRDL